jgi:hypothetical protein
MDLNSTFPAKYYLNLGPDEIRRRIVEQRFAEQGLLVKRQAAVDGRWLKNSRGYVRTCRAALALTKRAALRQAQMSGAEAVLLFEDDVVLHPEFASLVANLRLPDDWGIFFLGCVHMERPVPHSTGLVRVTKAYDHHAWAVRRNHFSALRQIMRGSAIKQGLDFSDHRVAELQREIPTYAAWPNLVWQDRELWGNCNYDEHGNQTGGTEAARAGFAEEMAAAEERWRSNNDLSTYQ